VEILGSSSLRAKESNECQTGLSPNPDNSYRAKNTIHIIYQSQNTNIVAVAWLLWYRIFTIEVESMAKQLKGGTAQTALKYARVDISGLDRGRRGKHHDLVQGILQELKMVVAGTALEIPLAGVGGIGVANLRSAVHRASTADGLAIETLADKKNFYVWRTATSK
jgi:hypothetical protein